MSAGKLRQLHLASLARFEHVGKAAAALEQLRQRIPEAACPAKEHSLAVANVDEAKRLKDHKRLADRGSADMQPVSQVALGGELGAGHHAGLCGAPRRA